MNANFSLKNPSRKAELKKKLDDGDINYSFCEYKSNFAADNHILVIDNWINCYGADDQTKRQLDSLKYRYVGNAARIVKEEIRNTMKVSFFMLGFVKGKGDEKKYEERSASVELFTSKEESRKLIMAYFHDLAILAITGGEDKYTLNLE
ncbi:hypothetical protein BDZ91DRAFT_735766 [Kalaharituber pfeilii]|nr:hypothetical protein BDZ91DRAFT_735766 [Kalaharituber pfeilii]